MRELNVSVCVCMCVSVCECMCACMCVLRRVVDQSESVQVKHACVRRTHEFVGKQGQREARRRDSMKQQASLSVYCAQVAELNDVRNAVSCVDQRAAARAQLGVESVI